MIFQSRQVGIDHSICVLFSNIDYVFIVCSGQISLDSVHVSFLFMLVAASTLIGSQLCFIELIISVGIQHAVKLLSLCLVEVELLPAFTC